MENQTNMADFVLLQISNDSRMKVLLFVLILGFYMITVMGNIGMAIVIWLSPCLHTPMYYFISNLSFTDFLLSSVIVPNMLQNLLAEKAIISFLGCAAQMYGLIALATTDSCLLSLMAYDRYIAICYPLHYEVIMDKERCCKLVAMSYIFTLLYSMTLTVPTMRLPFCGKDIEHFNCEIPPLLKLSCIDTTFINILLFSVAGVFMSAVLTFILISYIYILLTVLKFPSVKSRWKAFSTCGSHLLTVTLFYSTASMTYLRPGSSSSSGHNGILSVLYTVIVPMLNPFIYSVRNNDVKTALKALVISLCSFNKRY